MWIRCQVRGCGIGARGTDLPWSISCPTKDCYLKKRLWAQTRRNWFLYLAGWGLFWVIVGCLFVKFAK